MPRGQGQAKAPGVGDAGRATGSRAAPPPRPAPRGGVARIPDGSCQGGPSSAGPRGVSIKAQVRTTGSAATKLEHPSSHARHRETSPGLPGTCSARPWHWDGGLMCRPSPRSHPEAQVLLHKPTGDPRRHTQASTPARAHLGAKRLNPAQAAKPTSWGTLPVTMHRAQLTPLPRGGAEPPLQPFSCHTAPQTLAPANTREERLARRAGASGSTGQSQQGHVPLRKGTLTTGRVTRNHTPDTRRTPPGNR